MYAIAVEKCIDGGWRPVTEPYTQAFDVAPDEVARAVAKNWDLGELGHPWAVGVFKGVRFDEKCADLRG
jgi:hypothetical protein